MARWSEWSGASLAVAGALGIGWGAARLWWLERSAPPPAPAASPTCPPTPGPPRALSLSRKGAQLPPLRGRLPRKLLSPRAATADLDPELRRRLEAGAAAGKPGDALELARRLRDLDPVESRSFYRRAASLGSLDATYELGVLLTSGDPREQAEARQLFEAGVRAKHPASLFALGCLLARGEGGAPDVARALALLKEAVALGYQRAAIQLAAWKLTGEHGVWIDPPGAKKLLEDALAAGEPAAGPQLGLLYWEGRLGEPDYPRAVEIFRRYAERGDSGCMVQLGLAYEKALGVAADLERAMRYYRAAAKAGHPVGHYHVARLTLNQNPGPASKQTLRRLEHAAARGHTSSAALLGALLLSGQRVARDPTRGARYLRQAALGGDLTAMLNLARCHRGGLGVEQDREQARSWLRKSLRAGLPEAGVELAQLIRTDQAPDETAARAALTRALELGSLEAAYLLGQAHADDALRGEGDSEQARERAEGFLRRAAAGGHRRATLALADVLRHQSEAGQREAIELLRAALAQDAEWAVGKNVLGVVLMNGPLEDLDEARRLFESLPQDFDFAQINLAAVLLEQGGAENVRRADALLQTEADRGSRAALEVYVQALCERDPEVQLERDLDWAERWLNEARETAPKDPLLSFILARIYLATKRGAQARPLLKRASASFPEAAFLLGRTLLEAGDETRGASWIERAAKRGSRSARRHLCVAAIAAQDWGQAASYLQSLAASELPSAERRALARALLAPPPPHDPRGALRLLEAEVERAPGPEAHTALGRLLLAGAEGVAPEPARAKALLEAAANAGSSEARRLLED